jgi:hypothetical protein
MENAPKGERRISTRFLFPVSRFPFPVSRFPFPVVAARRTRAKQHERSFNGEVIWALREDVERHKDEK